MFCLIYFKIFSKFRDFGTVQNECSLPESLVDVSLGVGVGQGVNDGVSHVRDVERSLDRMLSGPIQWHGRAVQSVAESAEVIVQEVVVGPINIRGPEDCGVGELLENTLLSQPLRFQPL